MVCIYLQSVLRFPCISLLFISLKSNAMQFRLTVDGRAVQMHKRINAKQWALHGIGSMAIRLSVIN